MNSPMRLAPCIPHWLTSEREADMQVDDLIRNCVVFIGNEIGDQFHAEGTGFFGSLTNDDYDFRYVITAAHVIWPERRQPGNRAAVPEGEISIRVTIRADRLEL